MPDPTPAESAPEAPRTAPCRHLRNKGMYVYTDIALGDAHDDYDTAMYWCLQTMKGFGPDDEPVRGDDCRNPERSCYEPL
jgi:hypothetical protein